MDQSPGPDTREMLLGMYKEANQMLSDKVKALSIENTNLKKQIASFNVCISEAHHFYHSGSSN
jgi:hypothetical protein